MFTIKKNTVTLIVTVLVLVVMTVATVVLTGINNSEGGGSSAVSSDSPSSVARHKFFEFSKDDLKTVEIKNEHGSFILERIKEESSSYLVLKGNEKEKLNSSAASSSFNYIANMTSAKFVSSDSEKLSVYGLDAPVITVTAVLNDGSEHSLYVGGKTPDGSYYANTSDSADVYVVSTYAIEYFTVKRTELYPTDIFGKLEIASFNGFTLLRPDSHDIDIIKLSNEEYEEATNKAEANIKTQLELKTPFKYDVNGVYIENLVKAISELNATEVISDDTSEANLKKYGLDKPMTFTVKNGNVTIFIGKKDSMANVYYVMLEGRDLIYTVSADSLYFVEEGANKFAYSMVGIVALKNVASLKIEGGGKSYEFTCGDDFDNLEVFHGTTELPPEEFKKLYQQIFSATQNGLADGSHSKELHARITYNKKDGTKVVIEYYKVDSSRYYAEVNGEGIFTVRGDMVEKVLADCERILNGEIITVV